MKLSIWILLASFLFVSCQVNKKQEEKKVITVSILPQKTFVEKIAGGDFKVNVLIPPGASPATYTLLPSQLKDIVNSVAWFRIGYIGFEYSWKDKIAETNKEMKVYNLSEGLDLIADKVEDHGDHVHMDGIDPHVWLSTQNVKKMAEKIKDVLNEINPENKDTYLLNYHKFVKEIDQVNIQVKNTLKDVKGKTFILFHPSLTYFARDYELNQVSLESGGKEPTAQHIKEVVDLANKHNIKTVYIQTEFDREHARVFAEEIGGVIMQIAPLDPYWAENMVYIAQTIRDNN